jgi:ADP-heptose:LPS heptosyltransferase
LLYYDVSGRVIRRRIERRNPEKLYRSLGLAEFYEKRNKVLIIRAVGGLGDIFMHRMMFADFKRLIPDAEIHFACPRDYHAALIDHPFIDVILDSTKVEKSDYILSYNTTTACGRYEMRMAPFSDLHRSDIWAGHCGVRLENHDMHISLTSDEIAKGRSLIDGERDGEGPVVVFCPISAMSNKNLLDWQRRGVVDGLRERGCCVVGLHHTPIPGIPTISGVKIREWMSVLYNADYVVSVDTAAFHCAGGMGKPLVGVFTFSDGLVYGKYYDFTLVQRHRSNDPSWTCGPCYNFTACPKTKMNPKPCLTELSVEMILAGFDEMRGKTLSSNGEV